MPQLFTNSALRHRLFDIANVVFMLIFSFIILYPFVNLIALSLNDGTDAARGGIYFYPRVFSLDSYKLLLQNQKLLDGILISILRVVVGTFSCLCATGLLAYIVTIRTFSGRKFLRLLFLVTMYFSGGLIPSYLLILSLHMTNTFSVYWIPSLINVYFMLIIASYMQNLPDSVSESARMDGASELGIYFRIIFPMSLPVFSATAVFSAVGHWNSWFDVVLYNSSGEWDTLQVYLTRMLLEVEALQTIRDQEQLHAMIGKVSPVTLRAATTIVVTLPIAMVYPFLQKYFVGGITLGAVKG
ncbi:carbohydrate ABC transporter permease (plasmid) [Paenibacillus rhizovicinus]|uniref:Carbohydrate ABC transporter permease n=1 Tax=Paenibacillus rhizovicinus TaxID=2704463 RepID=A0A6C0PAV8_9BACL|nr:carbohydrate ABC transporter permease [Paenibacillus rhizovicinus]QHW35505.1 carbohydrate ABC transporter permease [Paenibacillus rhizovicinus]